MITWLSRWLISDYENVKNPEVRRRYGTLCSMMGICLNLCLFAGKCLAGILSGSIAVMADAFNNISDAGSSVITLAGFKAAGRKPDKEHPFGHGRMEYLSGLAVAAAILLMGVELVKCSVEKILHPAPVEAGALSLGILAVSVGIKLYMSFYNRRIGAKIASTAMKATAADSLCDAAATTAVILSILVQKMTGLPVDGWCGILVAGFILFSGWSAAKETLSPLLGQPPEPEFIDEIYSIALSHPEIVGIHDLIVHDYGPGCRMISLHAEVPGDGDVFDLHDVVDRAEKELKERLGCEAVIHLDPVEMNNEKIFLIRQETEELVREIHEEITIHDFRMVKGKKKTKLVFDAVVPYHVEISEQDAERQIQEKVKERWSNYLAVVSIDRHMYCRKEKE